MRTSTNMWIEKHGAEALHLYANTDMRASEIAARYEGATKNRLISYAYSNGLMRKQPYKPSKRALRARINGSGKVDLRYLQDDVCLVRACSGDLKKMLAKACELSAIGVADVVSDARCNDIARRRWRVCYLLRQADLSYPRIGLMLKKHHTSVLYGVQAVEACIADAQEVAA
ncbi:MAG: helix-turn-helix domain-containing protein [Asticcacaulis sp.]|uniref:helix-turn-helix domain-containing protein n=1 Tax=Asticcacaulis sp. TaxID=1872648 RepID=UPI0039E2B517